MTTDHSQVQPAVAQRLALWIGLLACERERRAWRAVAVQYGDDTSPAAAYARFMWWRCERNVYAMRVLCGRG